MGVRWGDHRMAQCLLAERWHLLLHLTSSPWALRQAPVSHLLSSQCLFKPDDSGRTTLPFSKDKSFRRTEGSQEEQCNHDYEMVH